MSEAATAGTLATGEERERGLWRAVRRERGLLVAAAIWLWFVLNYVAAVLQGWDASVQYALVQKLYGDAPRASAYYFGLALIEAPFYGVGKLVDQLGLHQMNGHPIEPATIAFGMAFAIVPGAVALAWLLRKLRLPAPGFVLLTVAFGTPVFYYAAFYPGKNHNVDAALFSIVVWLCFLYFREEQPARWLPAALGAALGLSMTVRYFAGAELVPLVAVLAARRRWRDAAEVVGVSVATFGALALIPLAYGVTAFRGDLGLAHVNKLVFQPLNPFRMLFTDHRGLFLWSPIAVLAVFGLVQLVRRRPEHRTFLVVVISMGLAIVGSYAFVPFWDGGWSFSQRYFTSLFPLLVLGVAAAIEERRRLGIAIAALCALWSIYLCLNLVTIGGPQYESTVSGGASDLAALPFRTHTSPGAYAWGVYHQSRIVKAVVPWPFSH